MSCCTGWCSVAGEVGDVRVSPVTRVTKAVRACATGPIRPLGCFHKTEGFETLFRVFDRLKLVSLAEALSGAIPALR